jgi:hypothetical protein
VRVAVLTSARDDRLARVLVRAKRRTRVTVVDGSATASEVHVALAAGGRFDVVSSTWTRSTAGTSGMR